MIGGYIKFFYIYLIFLDCCSRVIRLCAQSLSIFLSPEQLMNLNFLRYEKQSCWKEPEQANRGLMHYEEQAIEEYLDYKGKVLVLFCGGGREIIYFLKKGYNKVVGVDFLPPTMESIQQYFNEDISSRVIIAECFLPDLVLDEKDFDLVTAFTCDFCTILGKKNRIKLLRNIYSLLKEGGRFIFNILIDYNKIYTRRKSRNVLRVTNIFVHYYNEETEFKEEVAEAGFSDCLIFRLTKSFLPEGMVILKK